MSNRIPLLLAILIAVAVAFLAGRWTVASPKVHLSAGEMGVAIDEAMAIESQHERLARLVALVGQLDATNAEGMAAGLAKNVSSTDNNDLRLLLSAWSELDPRAAFDAIMSWTLESKRSVGAGIVAYEWSRGGGALEVREYIQGLGQTGVRNSAIRGLVQGWARSNDIDGLTEFVSNERQVVVREQLTEILVNSLLSTGGVEAVMKWADAVPPDAEGEYKRTAFRKALRQVGNRDPEVAARWYDGQSGEAHARRALAIIAGEWAEHDPQRALEWILSQPAGRERDIGLKRWITRWTSNDHRAALEWMRQADLTGPLAHLPIQFLGALLPGHPAEAAGWVDRIEDPELRSRAIQEIAVAWKARDPVSAAKWRAERGLDQAPPAAVGQARVAPSTATPPTTRGVSPAESADEITGE